VPKWEFNIQLPKSVLLGLEEGKIQVIGECRYTDKELTVRSSISVISAEVIDPDNPDKCI